jgi:LPXTG-motif cell wall-anchored protein
MMARGARGKTRLRLILRGVAIGLSVGLSAGLTVGLTVGLPLGVAGSVGGAAPAFAEDETFLFDVVTLTGKRSSLVGYSSLSIDTVKARIQHNWGIPPDQQRLLYAGRELVDGQTLGFYGITAGVTLHLVLKLRGSATPTPEPVPALTPEDRELPDTGQSEAQTGILLSSALLLGAIGAMFVARRRLSESRR